MQVAALPLIHMFHASAELLGPNRKRSPKSQTLEKNVHVPVQILCHGVSVVHLAPWTFRRKLKGIKAWMALKGSAILYLRAR